MKNILLLSIILIIGCSSDNFYKTYEVKLIDLGKISDPNMQISGMDFYHDQLYLIPQLPVKKGPGRLLYTINKSNILNHLQNPSIKIEIGEVVLLENGLEKLLPRIEWEGIAFNGDTVYCLIENDQDDMKAYLVKASIGASGNIMINPASLKQVPMHLNLHEMACEALVVCEDRVIVFYEVNGVNVNKTPQVFIYDLNLNYLGLGSMPNIEYRISDATKTEDGKFWVLNVFWPGDEKKLSPAEESFYPSTSNNRSKGVKRLIELNYHDNKISINNKNTIMLSPEDWNWEGLTRFDNGFLIVNDTYAPGTDKTWLGYIKTDE